MRLCCKLLIFSWCVFLTHPTFAAESRAEGAVLYVNELKVLSVGSWLGGRSPQQRAGSMATAFARLPEPIEISLRREGSNVKIMAGPAVVAIVTPNEAKFHKSDTFQLATNWAANITRAVSLPPLQVGQDDVRIVPGIPKFVRLIGSAASTAVVKSGDENTLSVKRVPGGLSMKGLAYGQATINISSGDNVALLIVNVQPYAAKFPQSLFADVSGIPATVDTVQGSLEQAVRTRLSTRPGAGVEILEIGAAQVAYATAKTFPVRVRVEAPDTFPIEGMVNVVVRNVPLSQKLDEELWYCNDPENLKKPGPLFATTLASKRQARLLYHHINVTPSNLVVEVKLVNADDVPAQVMLISGDSGPERNPVRAGMTAADKYIRGWIYSSAEIVSIPPRSSMPISLRRLAPQETTSGLCSLRLLEGGAKSVLVRTDARIPTAADYRVSLAYGSATPWRLIGPRALAASDTAPALPTVHVYPGPAKTEMVNYQVGGNYGSVRIGQRPISSSDQRRSLEGNFGVFYTIRANLSNPTRQAADVELVFEASAGYTGALFVINRQIKRTPLLQPKTEAQILRFHMRPGSKKSVTLLTVPLSGSSYPVTVTVRPVEDSSVASKPLFDALQL